MPGPRSAVASQSMRIKESDRATPGRPSGRVTICRLRVSLPESAWIGRFSRLHPDVDIQAVSRFDISPQRSVTEIQLRGPASGSWAAELRTLPQVREVEELEGGPSGLHLRVTHQTVKLVPIFRQLHLMVRFPFTIQSGDAFWMVVASEAKIRRLLRRLQDQAPGVVLESVRHTDPTRKAGPLTPRQTDVLRRAMAAGYFEVPRKVTLTDLAKNLGLAASSLSESLAIVEKKLLEQWPIGDGFQHDSPPTTAD